jgi:ABC-type microcin C transport system permease subunit YejE
MRRLLCVLGSALLVLVALTPTSLAAEDWCSDDPLMVLATPGGTTVPVYVLTTAPMVHSGSVMMATYRYTADHYVRDAAGDLGTAFTIYVTVPNDPLSGAFGVRDAVNSGPAMGASVEGNQMAAASGYTYVANSGASGTAVALTFDYPQP